MRRTALAIAFLLPTSCAARADDVITFPRGKKPPPSYAVSKQQTTTAPSSAAAPTAPAKSAAAATKTFIDTNRTNLDGSRAVRDERAAARMSAELADLQRYIVPKDAFLVLSPKLKEAMARRVQQPSAKEQAVMSALASTIDIKTLDGLSLQAVLGTIATKTGLTLVPDVPSAGELLGQYRGDIVKLRGKNLSVRDVLRQTLFDRGMAYLLEDDCVRIVSIEKANATMVVRTYDITDLVVVVPNGYGRLLNALELQRLIRIVIEPTLWAPEGPGTTAIMIPRGTGGLNTITIRANAEGHFTIGSVLSGR